MTLANLRSLARFFVFGDSTNTAFSDADTLVAANAWYRKLIVWALQAAGAWQYRGGNSATINITAATRQYDLGDNCTSYLRITKVEIKYPSSASKYRPAAQIDPAQIDNKSLDEYTTGNPQFDLTGDKIEIFVSQKTANITAVTAGIKIYFENDITALSASDSAPEIPEPFVRLIALGMAYDYCLAEDLRGKMSKLEQDIEKEKVDFLVFVANRDESKRHAIRFRQENYGQQDLASGMDGYDKPAVNWG